MRFDTAINKLKNSEYVISLDRYSARLLVNKGLDGDDDLVIKSVVLEAGHGSADKIEAQGKRDKTDKAIEAMLIRHNMPLIGWLLDERYGSYPRKYNNPKIYFSILNAFRENDNLFRNMNELCEMVQIKHLKDVNLRSVKIHSLSLIEDHRGLIAEDDDDGVRLMNWHEALDFSEPLAAIEQVQCANESEKRFGKPDIFVPSARIYLNADNTLSRHWEIYPKEDGFNVHEFRGMYEPSGVSFHGDELAVDRLFEEHCLPLGWGATYGYNMSEHLRDQEIARKYKRA